MSGGSVEVEALKMAPWGTQVVVVVLPTSAVLPEEGARRFRIGLTITSARLLPDLQQCYKCHMLGHAAAR